METPDWFDESQFVPTAADRLPAADIDELFEQAFDNPGYRAEFNRRLPDSNLWVLVEEVPSAEDAVGELMPIAPLQLSDGSMPLFTSEARVREAEDLPAHIRWIQLRARELMAQMQGVDYVLNPFSSKQLTLRASGIPAMLAGHEHDPGLMMSDCPVPASGQVTIDLDKEFPTGMVDALQALLSQHPRVREAYMLYIKADAPDALSRYHMRIEVDGSEEVKQLMTEMQPVLRAFMQRDEGFELWTRLGDDDMAGYMRERGPIYERV
ncbi:enhanced serine sensitivity protein SseB C-terminal domain-containing protein [Hymenobacter sp. ASUV-10]|uniref:Enhanced serine sensitivity protein SseB C-terminal domain-containing protein n=1 Tax=Hymenobacter aranciens TaxID=3063996 RepID=A0ABT9BFQ5_9BACT|nr:enhanced serine sensitivity protein SseB C-terminal domain-containing protein [Hymenobacter sp. ASUV-10]MDO7876488.1 enhanced serine sensitivity protein SseB C-terminal domain-containing protein [Hymenobacter sp. ASUV-10]